MSFVERFIVLCPYLGESTIRGSTVYIWWALEQWLIKLHISKCVYNIRAVCMYVHVCTFVCVCTYICACVKIVLCSLHTHIITSDVLVSHTKISM